MLNIVITFTITYIIFSGLYEWKKNTNNEKTHEVLESILSIPILMPIISIYIILYPFALVYRSFKHLFNKSKASKTQTYQKDSKKTLNLKLPD